MDALVARQFELLRQFIANYRDGRLSLNALVQRVEGMAGLLGAHDWENVIFPIVLAIEQVNAMALYEQMELTMDDKNLVENALIELELIIHRFEVG